LKIANGGPWLEPTGDKYTLAVDWTTDCLGLLDAPITIPAGYVTDGASVPRFLWPICGTPMESPRICAAIVHDWLYDVGGDDADRKTADVLYKDYNIALGMTKFTAIVEYHAIRLFGGSHFNYIEK